MSGWKTDCPPAQAVEPEAWPVSSDHSPTAALICRMLLMQAFCCEVARAFTKLGIAIAASKPMMATTIMISTSVKPALRDCFVCFILYYFLFSELRWNFTTGGLYDYMFVHFIACNNRTLLPKRSTGRAREQNYRLRELLCQNVQISTCLLGLVDDFFGHCTNLG